VGSDGNACGLEVIRTVVECPWAWGQVEYPVRSFRDIRPTHFQVHFVRSCRSEVHFKGSDKLSAPYSQSDQSIVLYRVQRYAMHSLEPKSAFRRDISRIVTMIEAQKWSLCGDKQGATGDQSCYRYAGTLMLVMLVSDGLEGLVETHMETWHGVEDRRRCWNFEVESAPPGSFQNFGGA
jgi:hypothetical protein